MNDNNNLKGEKVPEEAFEALTPDSLAEATTEALDDKALNGHVSETNGNEEK